MTLLQQLIDGATGDAVPVTTLLRQAKVIAARVGADPLDEWVTQEMQGYPGPDRVPAYRGPFDAPVTGRFELYGRLEDRPIPPSTFPAEWRPAQFQVWIMNPVAELAELAKRDFTRTGWSADVVRAYNTAAQDGKIQGLSAGPFTPILVSASRSIPAHVLIGVLDAVRSRILNLALGLEKVSPEIGQPGLAEETNAAAEQVVNVYFHGPVANAAIGGTNISQTVTVNVPGRGDEAGLLRYLAAAGVQPGQLVDLQRALADDRTDAGGAQPATPGRRVRAWAAGLGTDLAANAAGGLLAGGLAPLIAHALKAFFGG